VALCTIGSCHTELGQYEEALKYLDQDLGIARELKDLEGEAKTYGNMGNVFYSQGNTAMASNVYLACQRCAEEAGTSRRRFWLSQGGGKPYALLILLQNVPSCS